MQSSGNGEKRAAWWRSVSLSRIHVFIQSGIDISKPDKKGWTPLHSAARHSDQREIIAVLLKAGANVNAKDNSGDTPLHWAAAENVNVDVLITLIQAGANVNERDKFGWIPLHTAAWKNSNPEIIVELLKSGSNRRLRAYYILFSAEFLLKHNSNMAEDGKALVLDMLRAE